MRIVVACSLGSRTDVLEAQCHAGEPFEVDLTVTQGSAPHNGTGGSMRLCWRPLGSSQSPDYAEVTGNALGRYLLAIPERIARFLRGPVEVDAWWIPASGSAVQLTEPFEVRVSRAIGPVGLSIDETPPPVVAEPPIEQSLTVTAFLDLPGDSHPLTVLPFARVPYASPTRIRIVCPQLQTGTGTADPTATGNVYLSRNGVALGTAVALTQSTPGVFEGEIGILNQAACGTALPTTWIAEIITGGHSHYAFAPSTFQFFSTGKPDNSLPRVTLAALQASYLPGAVTLTGTASDDDGVLTAESFAVSINGVLQDVPVTYTGSNWSVTALLSALGETLVSVVVTDALGGQATASRTTNCVLPTVAITSPIEGATLDVAPASVSVTVTPAPPNGTAVAVYDGATQIGSGTLTAGSGTITTSALAAGSHSLTARVVFGTVGTAVSDPRTFAVVATAPVVVINSPTGAVEIGATVQVQATVTHAIGQAEIQSVEWRLNGGAWTALPLISGSIYRAPWVVTGEPGTATIDVRATDRTPGGTPTTATVTRSQVYPVVEWTGAFAFGLGGARMTAPTSGALTLALDPTAAADGALLDLSVPAGPTSFSVTVPAGWTLVADASVTVGAETLDGGVSWQVGDAWRGFLVVDAPTQTVLWTARLTPVAMVTSRLWRLNGSPACSIGGVATPSADATPAGAPDYVADPTGQFGTVARGGNGGFQGPAGGILTTAVGYTVAFRVYFPAEFTIGTSCVPICDWRAFAGGLDSDADFSLYAGLRYARPQVYGEGETVDPMPEGEIFAWGYWEDYVWAHEAGTGVSRLYRNGSLIATITRAVNPHNNATAISFLAGGLGDAARYNGLYMRDVRLERRTWTDADVAAYGRTL